MQSGWPFLIHSQLARVFTVAGSMVGVASKSNGRRDFSRGNPAALILDPPFRTSVGPVVALRHQQLGEEAATGQLVLGRLVGDVGELVADRRQSRQTADGRGCRWPWWRPARSSLTGGAESMCFSRTVVTAAGAATSEQLVIGASPRAAAWCPAAGGAASTRAGTSPSPTALGMPAGRSGPPNGWVRPRPWAALRTAPHPGSPAALSCCCCCRRGVGFSGAAWFRSAGTRVSRGCARRRAR